VKRLALITLILGTALLVLVPVAYAMPVSDDGPVTGKAVVPSTQPANPATQALMLRSEGLARYYADSAATQAVILRSKGLAGYYGSGGNAIVAPSTQQGVVTDGWLSSITPSSTLRPDILGGNGGPSATPISTGGSSFDWNMAIGATLTGFLLLALAGATVTRRRHRLSF
jgi:hypothetical protein